MRVVVDTTVVIAGLRSRTGASAEILRRVLKGEIEAAASTALLLEYEAVATRDEHRRASGLAIADILVVLDALAGVMAEVPIRWRMRPLSPDPNDDLVIEAALNAGADVLVTVDARDLAKPCAELGIRTVPPAVLLSELRTGE